MKESFKNSKVCIIYDVYVSIDEFNPPLVMVNQLISFLMALFKYKKHNEKKTVSILQN
jgi:hypothetical protein